MTANSAGLLSGGLCEPAALDVAKSMSGSAVSIRRLRKLFGKVAAVDDCDLQVERGECFGLLGPNGAGKTTTIEICEGLTKPDAGTVEILGLNWSQNATELRQHIGAQLQETQFQDRLTVEETIRLFRSFFHRGLTVDGCIATVQLEEKRRAHVGTLSGGQKQRLAMACALVGDPQVLFLDEPTTGLDPQARRHAWDLLGQLKRDGRTIILTTHYMDEAERLCDRIGVMDHGRVIALGTPLELISSVGGQHIIELAVGRDGELDCELLAGIPGVQSHRLDANTHKIVVSDLHTTLPSIFETLASRNLLLTELRTHSATLEDVFVSLTGRKLRDE
jgi:ABC-2 type transport system ATP-binding protein